MQVQEYKAHKREVFPYKIIGIVLFVSIITITIFLTQTSSATPGGPTVTLLSNSSYNSSSTSTMVNTSGGYIFTVQLNSSTQNTRWKGYVGNVTGQLVLSDSGGNKLYNWNDNSTTGEVYATRHSSTISWASLECANTTYIAQEDLALNQTNGADNLTATFSSYNHSEFYIGTNQIQQDNCSSIYTYVNNASQQTSFDEVILRDTSGGEIVFATILEDGTTGYDGRQYDFQLILPENGTSGWSGTIPYYFYIELE